MKKYGKEVLYSYERYLDGEHFEVLVCDGGYSELDNDSFYDVHLVSEKYCDDEFNTLKLQEPKSAISDPDSYFSNSYLIGHLMEHFIWDRFYEEGVFEGYVKSEFNKHEEVA